MKKIFLILFVFIFCIGNACAGEIIDTDTIYWDWSGPTPETSGLPSADPIANDLKFHLYMADQSGIYNIGSPNVEITYVESTGDPYNYEFNLTINGTGGTIITRYFVLTAYYDGGESDISNEVSKTIEIPKDRPLQLRFTISIE